MTAPDHATSHSQNTLRERGHPYMGFGLEFHATSAAAFTVFSGAGGPAFRDGAVHAPCTSTFGSLSIACTIAFTVTSP
jgi:hypothetical protein